jgi:hypothetical protein
MMELRVESSLVSFAFFELKGQLARGSRGFGWSGPIFFVELRARQAESQVFELSPGSHCRLGERLQESGIAHFFADVG